MSKIKVSIIIVHYKGIGQTNRCLRSIYSSRSNTPFEVILVDNSISPKKIGKAFYRFHNLKYFKSVQNIGYAAGNNLGVKHAKGKYLFILNPDTELRDKAIDKLVAFLDENPSAAVVAPNLITKNGKIFEDIASRELTPVRGIFVLSFINKVFPNNYISRDYFLRDVSKTKINEVDTVPGTALIIRIDVYRKVGGFDENFFLYFEESDLCKRVRNLGWKIYIFPDAEVTHDWKPAEGGEEMKKIFSQSRFYYFRKHYGLTKALLIEGFARISKWNTLLFLVFGISVFIRFYRLPELMEFIGDYGWYYLSARDFLLGGSLPLVGITSSVPILRQGAIFTWLLAFFLKIFNFNPVSGAYLTASLGVLSVLLVYKVFSEWYGKRVGIIGSLLATVSPFIVTQDRTPFVIGPMFTLTLLIALVFTKIQKGNPLNYTLLGFLLAIIYQFELASFILFPILLITFIWQKIKFRLKKAIFFILGLIFGLLPFIVWDLQQGVYLQTLGFLGWVVTKVIEGGIGIFSGNRNVSLFGPAIDFIRSLIFPKSFVYALFLFLMSIYYFLKKLRNELKKLKFSDKLVITWLLVAILGFFVRGIFSGAYMPLLYLPILAMVSLALDRFILNWGRVGVLILLMTVFVNIVFLFKTNFTSSYEKYVTLEQRLESVDLLLSQVGDKDYTLVYRGPSYQFASGDNNWKYLLWFKGNEPKAGEVPTYGIFEYPYGVLGSYKVIGSVGYVKIGVKYDRKISF